MYVPPILFPRRGESFRFTIREVESSWDRWSFVRAPWQIHRGDRYWTPPLIREQLALLDPRRNPFLRDVELALFCVEAPAPISPDEVVGTIAAWIDRPRNQATGHAVGFFGLFETLNNAVVAERLLLKAEEWLGEHLPAIEVIRGPASLHPARGAGLLVDGFDVAPAATMPYSAPYYEEVIEAAGYVPGEEWSAFRLRLADVSTETRARLARRSADIKARWGVNVRSLDVHDLPAEIQRVRELSDVTWAAACGCAPLASEGLAWLARGFKRYLDPSLCVMIEREGVVVALGLGLPDAGPALRAANGGLFPFGWLPHAIARRRLDQLKVFPPLIHPDHDASEMCELLCCTLVDLAIAQRYRSSNAHRSRWKTTRRRGHGSIWVRGPFSGFECTRSMCFSDVRLSCYGPTVFSRPAISCSLSALVNRASGCNNRY